MIDSTRGALIREVEVVTGELASSKPRLLAAATTSSSDHSSLLIVATPALQACLLEAPSVYVPLFTVMSV